MSRDRPPGLDDAIVATMLTAPVLRRGQCVRDSLRKLAVYETSWLRNMQCAEVTERAAESNALGREARWLVVGPEVQRWLSYVFLRISEVGQAGPPTKGRFSRMKALHGRMMGLSV